LQLKEQPFFDHIGTFLQAVQTSATISVLWATVFWIKMLATTSDDCQMEPPPKKIYNPTPGILGEGFVRLGLDVVRIPMMSISRSEVMAISAERSDARLSQCESVIGIRQGF